MRTPHNARPRLNPFSSLMSRLAFHMLLLMSVYKHPESPKTTPAVSKD
jgi:hypothetical protein